MPLSLLFPRLCAACNRVLHPWEESLCLGCLAKMPLTRFHLDPGNPLAQSFWGKVWIEQASAWFYFLKGSRYQRVMHLLKYQNQPRIGIDLGKAYGFQLRHCVQYQTPDVIVPVPLHPRRQRKRGYNQSEMIARGLAEAMQVPVVAGNLVRSSKTSTQTRKSRYDRYLNVSGVFTVRETKKFENRHLLLVDDIVTTGATLEACAETLLKTGGVKLSVAALGWARKMF